MKGKHLDVIKKNEQKKILLQMKKEIQMLEFQIQNLKLMNFTNNTVKNLKIRIHALKIIVPIHLYPDREKDHSKYMKEIAHKYQPVDISLLETKLQIKRNNYKRLTR